MHLISALISGVRGAENGSVQVSRRGTAQPATVYQSFEGGDPDANGFANLDSNGGVELYVDTTATVKVFSKDGNVVREFVAASAAPAIEVRSASFTGQEYDDGSGIKPAGGGQPTTLQAIADLWLQVNLAKDFKIGDGQGNEITLPDLIVALLHGSLDVTAPQFGAKGDGINDDLQAFIDADAEATSRGGATILVPASSAFYRWSSTFTPGPLNNLIGVSPASSRIQIDAGAVTMLNLSGGALGRYIEGLSFTAIGVHTGAVIETDGVTSISRCIIGDGVLSQGDLVKAELGAVTRFTDCKFALAAAAQSVYAQFHTNDETEVFFTRCKFLTPVGVYTGDMFNTFDASVVACTIVAPPGVANTGNAFNVFSPEEGGGASDPAILRMSNVMCRLGDALSAGANVEGDCTLVRLQGDLRLSEASGDYRVLNRLISLQTGSGGFLVETSLPSLRNQAKSIGTSINVTPVDIPAIQHGSISFTWTGAAGGVVLDLENGTGMTGARLLIRIKNSSGGNIQVTLGVNGTGLGSNGNLANGKELIIELSHSGSSTDWAQVGAAQTLT